MKTPRPPQSPVTPTQDEGGERIQKILAHAGLGSRRQIEQWITDGQVRINGLPAKPGDRLREGDRCTVGGKPVNYARRLDQPTRVLLYHKPTGEVVTRRDPEGRPTIFTQLPRLRDGRWIAVGRLDINTQGLLLVTNNGELANRLMHPRFAMEREYAVRILGELSDNVIERLTRNVELDDGPAHFNSLVPAGGEGVNRWYHVVLQEGRNRIVRRLFEAVGFTVSRLMRIRYGDTVLPPRLKARTFYEMNEKEINALLQQADLATETRPEAPRPRPNTRRFDDAADTGAAPAKRAPQRGAPPPRRRPFARG